MNFNSLDVIIMIVYLLMLVIIGVIGARRAKSPRRLLLAGRKLGFLCISAVLAPLFWGGDSTIGATNATWYELGVFRHVACCHARFRNYALGVFLAKTDFETFSNDDQ